MVTFPSSYLTEHLKLGDAASARAIHKQLGLETLEVGEVGLALSFNEDRALTAVQRLFAFGGLQPQETVPLTPQAQLQWGCEELPVMVSEVKAYTRSYAQSDEVDADAALSALKTLCAKRFHLAYSDAKGAPLRCLHAPVLAVQKYKLKGVRTPTHLRIALTPVLLQGVYPEATGFRAKPKDLHARIVSLTRAGPGRPPEQLLRLTAWLLTLSKRPTVQVSDQRLAERLRSQALKHSQVSRFRKTLSAHFEVYRQLELLQSYKAPGDETGGHWEIRCWP